MSDEQTRCGWCRDDADYVAYHDLEWGVPVVDRQALFERLVLESMQAGLSWLTVLRKRTRMREQFFGFDIERLAAATDRDVERWLMDEGIIRHRGKLQAMIGNARVAQEMPQFAEWLWEFAPAFEPGRTIHVAVPSETDESRQMSKALKRAGFRFVGPTICYAFMQSVGMVNDHAPDCWRHPECDTLLSARA